MMEIIQGFLSSLSSLSLSISFLIFLFAPTTFLIAVIKKFPTFFFVLVKIYAVLCSPSCVKTHLFTCGSSHGAHRHMCIRCLKIIEVWSRVEEKGSIAQHFEQSSTFCRNSYKSPFRFWTERGIKKHCIRTVALFSTFRPTFPAI